MVERVLCKISLASWALGLHVPTFSIKPPWNPHHDTRKVEAKGVSSERCHTMERSLNPD